MNLLKSKVSLDKFVPHVLAHAIGTDSSNGLPESAAKSFILNSAISFAERSGILRETVTVDLQCGMSTYPIESLDQETVIGVVSARLGHEFETENCGLSWSWGNVCFEFNDDQLTINPAPSKDIDGGLNLKLIVAPSREACEIDEVFYSKWHDAIVNGALAEIHMMPSQPWSSIGRSDYRRRLFNEDVSRANIRVSTSNSRQPLQAQMSNWYIPSRRCQRVF